MACHRTSRQRNNNSMREFISFFFFFFFGREDNWKESSPVSLPVERETSGYHFIFRDAEMLPGALFF